MEVRAADEAAGGAVVSPSPPKERIPGALFRVDSLATLTAPVTTRTRARSARLPRNLRPFVSSPGGVGSSIYGGAFGEGGLEGEEKFPLPDNVDVWARYGFIDGRYLSASARDVGSTASGERPVSHRALVRIRADSGDGWRRQTELQRSASAHVHRTATAAPSQGPSSTVGIATQEEEMAPSHSVGGGRRGGGEGGATLSVDAGVCTPSTVILTPTSQERYRQSDPSIPAHAANGSGRRVSNAAPSPAHAVRTGDSLAAAVAAAASTAAASAAASAEETKEEELLALQQEEQQRQRDEADDLMFLAAGRGGACIGSGASSSSSFARPGRRPPRSMAEIERHKRNRAERLRAYGCQRPLYARIVPGGTGGGGSGSSGGSGCAATDEMETEQWVDTLRVSASLRGESLMAACTQSFADEMLGERQSEARASRTADVSDMEGPDGLLHCAVLKGDHALAARAAQFLVDKRGASVNSRDPWGRTPLHTASGKGMVAMARFFIRRGANVDALDQDGRTPLFFACASGNITMARYLTRIEVDARVDIADARGNLAGHYFWNSVGPEGREEIAAVLASSRWPDSRPPRDRSTSRLRGRSRGNRNSSGGGGGGGGGRGRERRQYSRSVPPLGESRGRAGGWGPDGDRSKRHSDGGEAGMKRLASDMMMLMKRR